MEPLEARALLLQHLRWSPESVAEDLQKACDMVAERLGYLALAVDLAGAYIGNDADSRSALWQYLTDYDRHQDDLLRSDYSHGLSATDKTVWTVWDTMLERLERRYAELQPGLLLAFLARFSGGVVQDELFRLASLAISTVCKELYDGAVELPSWLDRTLTADGEDWDSYYYRQSRDLLVRYSLLQRIEGEWPGVAMHGLVQWRARKYQQGQLWDKWYVMTILAGCGQLSKEDAGPQFRRHALAHITEMGWRYLDKLEVGDEMKAFVWRTIGKVYYDEGRWKEAEELFVQVMETSSRVLGEEHPSTLTSMANLASTFWYQGRWKEAEELFVQVMETSSRVLGEEHPNTLTSMADLASTYENQGRWKEAEELEVQVIETRKRVLGEEHPDTLREEYLDMLTSMANLASTPSFF
ncbi:MAG: hypothetical protein M1840_002464 [Geoglossum simile]|nr:MAG: hypothetical protein M1840_002464 [Geoglossum simile]